MVPCSGIPEPLPEACERNPKQGERDDFVSSHTPCSVASGEGRGSAGGPKERAQTHPHPAHVAQFAFVSQRVLEYEFLNILNIKSLSYNLQIFSPIQ